MGATGFKWDDLTDTEINVPPYIVKKAPMTNGMGTNGL